MLPVKGLAKEAGKGGRKRFLAALEMTVWGNGYPDDSVGNGYPMHHTKNVWEKRSSRIVIPSEVEGSFSLAVRWRVFDSEKRETPSCRKGGRAVLPLKGFTKEAGKGDEKDFSLRSK